MNISIKRHITDAVKHRYLTDLNVNSSELNGKIVDVVTPTYLADHNQLANYQALTISPMNASLIGATSIPFNNLIKLAGVDMSALKTAMQKVKEKELSFVSVGYGGLSINVIHFLSLLAYRTGVEDVFKNLHIYENDNLSYTNVMRIYKDLTHFKCNRGDRINKTLIFDEDNLAENIMLHQYYLTEEHIGDVDEKTVFFGAPDFDTRKMLEDKNFLFGGHQGDSVVFVYQPEVDSDLTAETYGTINLSSFYLNMVKAAEQLMYTLASDAEMEEDSVVFSHNAKKAVDEKYAEVLNTTYGGNVKEYEINDSMSLVI